jgi:sulfopropanediol 3-dehydrogenase
MEFSNMPVSFLKKATKTPASGEDETRSIVQDMLTEIESGGEDAARAYGEKLDHWKGDIIVGRDAVNQAASKISQRLKDDIWFAHERVRDFAIRQRESIGEFEAELSPGLWAGQRLIPMQSAGCYVPGGRYAHVASAIMSITTAKVAVLKMLLPARPRILIRVE